MRHRPAPRLENADLGEGAVAAVLVLVDDVTRVVGGAVEGDVDLLRLLGDRVVAGKGRSTPGDVYTRVGGSTNTGGAARATPPSGMTRAAAATAVITTPIGAHRVLFTRPIKGQSSEGILKVARSGQLTHRL